MTNFVTNLSDLSDLDLEQAKQVLDAAVVRARSEMLLIQEEQDRREAAYQEVRRARSEAEAGSQAQVVDVDAQESTAAVLDP